MYSNVFSEFGLTDKEASVAKLVCTGKSNLEASKRLNLKEKTVKFHLTNIYRKLKIKSRSQLVLWSTKYIQPIKDDAYEYDELEYGYQLPAGFIE